MFKRIYLFYSYYLLERLDVLVSLKKHLSSKKLLSSKKKYLSSNNKIIFHQQKNDYHHFFLSSLMTAQTRTREKKMYLQKLINSHKKTKKTSKVSGSFPEVSKNK
jgi:hypothetical protein